MQKTILSVLSLALFVPGCDAGGGAACTEIGCTDGLWVEVDFSPGLTSGDYEIVLNDGSMAPTTCTFEVSEVASDCDGESICVQNADCDAVWNLESGTVGFNLEGTPSDLVVTVRQDSVDLSSVSLSPEYESVQPNGEGCEPTCEQATETVTVSM